MKDYRDNIGSEINSEMMNTLKEMSDKVDNTCCDQEPSKRREIEEPVKHGNPDEIRTGNQESKVSTGEHTYEPDGDDHTDENLQRGNEYTEKVPSQKDRK